MSAWIVSEDHIDALVCAGYRYGIDFDGKPIDHETAQAVGQALWHENHKSVNHRYNRRTKTPTYTPVGETNVPSSHVFKLAACYDYQACEHDGYVSSAAKAFVAALQEKVASEFGMTPEEYYESPHWNEGPWGI